MQEGGRKIVREKTSTAVFLKGWSPIVSGRKYFMPFWSRTMALQGRGINWVHAVHLIDTGKARAI